MRITSKIFILLTTLLALSFSSLAVAQTPDPEPTPTQKKVPYPSTEGVDFWLTFLRNDNSDEKDPTVELGVWVSSMDGAPVGIYDSNSSLLKRIDIPAGGAAYYKLPDAVTTYYPNANGEISSAVHVVAMDSVSRFSCAGFTLHGNTPKKTSDMALALPTNALKHEYVVQTFVYEKYATEFAIVITEDNTTIQVDPKQPLKTAISNGPFRKGQVIFAETNQPEGGKVVDLSGTTICADKPIAVFVGNVQALAPRPQGGLDGAHTYEQITPISNWGTKFYVSMVDAPDIKLNNFLITGYKPGTVKVEYNNGTSKTYPVDLGSVLETNNMALSFDVNQGITNAIVTSDVPVAVFNYMSAAAMNQSLSYDMRGNVVSAFIPDWNQAVPEMSFVTQSMDPEVIGDKNYRVQITAKKNEIGSITIKASNGSEYGFTKQTPFADGQMVTAVSEELPVDMGFVISGNKGVKFVGYVFSVGSAQANLHPLGFNPYLNEDSLFVRGPLAMLGGYPYQEMPQGWYHRQFRDFSTNIKQRLDTAGVCDGTPMEFISQLGETATVDELEFSIYPLDEGGRQMDYPIKEPEKRTHPTDVLQKFNHTFILEDDYPDIDVDNPRQYYYFKTQTVVKRSRLLCTEMDPIIDTLMSVVRVSYQYNDTTFRMLCMGDTLEFFHDSFPRQDHLYDVAEPIQHSSTKFVAYKGAKPAICDKDFYFGVNVDDIDQVSETDTRRGVIFSRTYQSTVGCDSISTVVIYVCDTFHIYKDTVLTHAHPQIKFPNKKNTMFAGKTIKTPGIYIDTLKTTTCPSCSGFENKDFEGCDSIIELRVHLRDTLRAEFCDSVYTMDAFGESPVQMDWGGYTWTGHLTDKQGNDISVLREDNSTNVLAKDVDYEFTKGLTTPETLTFIESRKICDDRVDSSYVLILTCNPSFSDYQELTICEDSIRNWPNRYEKDAEGNFKKDDEGNLVPVKITGPSVPDNTTKTFYRADHLQNSHGCDSVYIIKLKVYPTYNKTTETIYRCKSEVDQGNPYKWQDENGVEHEEYTTGYYGARYKLKQFPECDCDSAYTVHFVVVNDNQLDTTVHVCRTDDPFEIKDLGIRFDPSEHLDADYTKSVELVEYLNRFVSLPNVECKREENWHIYVHQTYENIQTIDTVCQEFNGLYEWDQHDNRQIWSVEQNKRIDASKIATDVVEPSNLPYRVFHYIDTIVGGTKGWKDSEGNMHGCDSIHTLTLYVAKTYNDELGTTVIDPQTLCDIDTMTWGGILFIGDHFMGELPTDIDPAQYQIVNALESPYTKDYTTGTWLSSRSDKIDCDSTTRLDLKVMPSVHRTLEDDYTCMEGDHTVTSYYYRYLNNGAGGYVDISYAHDTTMVDTIPSTTPDLSCDTVFTFTLHVLQTYIKNNIKRDTICMDEEYDWAEIRDPIKGTDDLLDGHVFFRGEVVNKIYTHIDNDELLSETLVFYDSLITSGGHGCDSIHVLELFVPRSYHIYDTLKMATDDTLRWHENFYVGCEFKGELKPEDEQKAIHVCIPEGQGMDERDDVIEAKRYYDELHQDEEHTCDSINYLHLRIGKVYRDTLYDTVCANESYIWKGVDAQGEEFVRRQDLMPITEPGFYKDTYETVLEFDSIFYLALEHWPIYLTDAADADTRTEKKTICQGDELTWDKHQTSKNHWWLKLPDESKAVTPADIAALDYGDYIIHDSLETEIHGCDSVWVMKLTITPTYDATHNKDKVTDELTLCSNDTLHWENKVIIGKDYDKKEHPIVEQPSYEYIWLTDDEDKKYDYTVPDGTKIYGCDSTRFLNLNICAMSYELIYDTISDSKSETGWFFGENHRYYRESFHLENMEDYAVTNRQTYKVLLIDTVKNSCGCDFIRHDSVLVVPSYRFRLPDTIICSSDDCNWYIDGKLIQEHVNTLQGIQLLSHNFTTQHFGADSIYEQQFTIVPAFEANESRNLCKNDTLLWHTYMLYYPNDGNDHVQYKAEYATENAICNAVYKLDVDYKPYYHFPVQEDEVCQYDIVDWPGREGHKEHAYRDEQGRPLDAIPTDTTGWITIYDSLHTVGCGCDSTYTLRRYVKPGFRHYEYGHVMCSVDSFYWDITGQYYKSKSAGYIRDTVAGINIHGCDSIHFLEIAVNQAYLFEDKDEICASDIPYEWPGHNPLTVTREEALLWTRDTTFILWDSLETKIAGCDSVYRRELLVHPVLRSYNMQTICEGDTLHHNGHELTEAGTYVDTIQSVVTGCDSITTLVLELIPPTKFVVTPPSICANEVQYELPFTYTGLDPIGYSVFYDSLGHAHGLEDILEQALNADDASIIVPLPEQEDGSYLEPYNYNVSVLFDNGVCINPVPMTVSFLLEGRYPAESVLEQHWNDFIGILVPELNGGYNFSSYQWYRNDSLLVGETGPYLYQAHYLVADATYSVALTREGETEAFMTCPLTPDVSRVDTLMPTLPYLSVVPNCVVREHPVVNILSVNEGNYRIFDAVGSIITSGHFTPDEHKAYEITMPATSGIYIVEMSETSGLHRSVKVIVQ